MGPLGWACLWICLGLVLLVAGGELLVRGASRLAAAFQISPLVIGLTVVAFGTSAPELAVSLQAAFSDSANLAVGNVVGSNIFNVLLILGLSALITPLVVSRQLIQWDAPIMIAASLLAWLFSADGAINRLEGAVLFAGVIVYTWRCIQSSRQQHTDPQTETSEKSSAPPARRWLASLALVLAGLLLLGGGSRALIAGAVEVASSWGVSELIIGLTIVAASTSLPEVVTSLVAAVRGERDIAVGNVVGSNIFNLLCVLGLSSLIAPNGVAVSDAAREFDMPIMVATAIACLPIFFTGHQISRWEGGLFLFYYLAYTAYLVLHAAESPLSVSLGAAMTYFAIPLTIITLAVSVWRGLRSRTKLK